MAKAPNVSRSHSWKEPSTASSPGNMSLTWPGTVEAALCRHGGRGRFFPVLVLEELTHASVTLHSCKQAAPREAGCGAEQMGPRQQRASKLGCLGMISLRPDEEGPLGPSCLAQMIFAFPELHLKFGYDFCAKTNCVAKKLVAQFQQRPHPTQHPDNVHQMQSIWWTLGGFASMTCPRICQLLLLLSFFFFFFFKLLLIGGWEPVCVVKDRGGGGQGNQRVLGSWKRSRRRKKRRSAGSHLAARTAPVETCMFWARGVCLNEACYFSQQTFIPSQLFSAEGPVPLKPFQLW